MAEPSLLFSLFSFALFFAHAFDPGIKHRQLTKFAWSNGVEYDVISQLTEGVWSNGVGYDVISQLTEGVWSNGVGYDVISPSVADVTVCFALFSSFDLLTSDIICTCPAI